MRGGAGGASDDSPPLFSWWRNVGKRLGVLRGPAKEEDTIDHLPPEAIVATARALTVSGLLFLQLANGHWVPERSRKDEVRVVLVPADEDDASEVDDSVPAPVGDPVIVRYLRIGILKLRTPSAQSVQIAQVALRCHGEVLDLKDFTATCPGGHSPATELPEKLFLPRGKWLDLNFRTRGRSVLILCAPAEVAIDDIAFRTGADAPGRDPVLIHVAGSVDGWSWVTLHDARAVVQPPLARRTWSGWTLLRVPTSGASSRVFPLDDVETPQAEAAHPSRFSWWRNATAKRLPVFGTPQLSGAVVGWVQPQGFFPVLRLPGRSADGAVQFLRLGEGEGEGEGCGRWVPRRSPKHPEELLLEPFLEQLLDGEWTPLSSAAKPAVSDEAEAPPAKVQRSTPSARLVHLRVCVLRTRSASFTQIAQVALQYGGKVLDMSTWAAESSRGQSPVSETPARVLVNGGNWVDFDFALRKQSVLILTAPDEVSVDDFSFRTSNDVPSRDPTHLRIDGSLDAETWVVLHDTGQDCPTPSSQRTWAPWLQLSPGQPAPPLWPESNEETGGFSRFKCPEADCDSYGSKEGYLVEGQLLGHMRREHPSSSSTKSLESRLGAPATAAAPPPPAAQPTAASQATPSSGSRSARAAAAPSAPRRGAPPAPPAASRALVARIRTLFQAAELDEVMTTTDVAMWMNVDSAVVAHVLEQMCNEGRALEVGPESYAPAPYGAVDQGSADEDFAEESAPVRKAVLPAPSFLAGLEKFQAGEKVDVVATISGCDGLVEQELPKNAGVTNVRRFTLRHGELTTYWVLFGAQAEHRGEELLGREICIRGATIQIHEGRRNLVGATSIESAKCLG